MSYRWLTPESQTFLERDYLMPGQTVDERIDIICNRAEELLQRPGHAARLKECLQKGWITLASPILTNFGTSRGLPISCFGSSIEDSMESIVRTHAEVCIMTKHGGGTSGYFGKLRGRNVPIKDNGVSSGSVHFMQLFNTAINVVSQGTTRRGQFAAYQDIEHPDVEEFLKIRSDGNKIQDILFGVCVSDAFMERMIDNNGPERVLWAKVLQSRAAIGLPYIFFTDNANRQAPDCYRNEGMKITHSNLCTEIMLPDCDEESFVCDLSSMVDLYYDEWKDTHAVETLAYTLEAVMTEFIMKGQHVPYLERAVRFARRHRALGIGRVGWHSYLQSLMLPFEGLTARLLNAEISATIQRQALAASKAMAVTYGEPEVLKGYGRRNATLIAIAPTKSTAFIFGQLSEGIEPWTTNYQVSKLQKGSFPIRNRFLQKLLAAKGKDTEETWKSILEHSGSVQHFDFLDKEEKAVFKTFVEISPLEVVEQAAGRQRFIDQGQSTNLMIQPSIPIKDVNALLITAWRKGLKSLYYQKSVNAAQEFARNIMHCAACEG
jgi:ribonucleoside-diphosphate reductase alpha chain